MKKIAFVLIIVLSLGLMTGCKEEKTQRFNPDKDNKTLNKTTTTITKIEDDSDETPEKTIEPIVIDEPTDNGPELAVTSFKDGTLDTNIGYHVIRGTTPKSTAKIMINNYKLQRYYPGQTAWSYITSESLGTLKEGENKYTVQSVNKNGITIASKTFTVNYAKVQAPGLPDVGNNSVLAILLASVLGSLAYFKLRKRMGLK